MVPFLGALRGKSQPTITSDLSLLSDDDLAAATNRAWREASRCWMEFRREPATSPIKAMLLTSADAAESWWADLRDEASRRDSLVMDGPLAVESPTFGAVEVRSADLYEVIEEPEADFETQVFDLPDGGTTTIPQQPKAPVTSPWVRNAASKTLPYRVEGGSSRDDGEARA